ncbi:TIGR03083 family protein [Nakamurella panacisegetis]|uniref:TIGR03083 family protein n=1 Tax=Nakamurella panacisegetis TaxID=1090615 RepID=A0A1H0T1P5_9ACTN|nr:maleylpyruvate isomerase family mycothiol-dependent enzyme [Nakamurella panacisegetis]SDP48032.1 TIGR03083 family protein [Nakamurella panacisegetis]
MDLSPGLLGTFRAEASALLAAVRAVDQGAPVPACPGLTVNDIVRHVGGIYRLVSVWIVQGCRPETMPDAPEDPFDWAAEGADRLHRQLAGLDPAAPCATWFAADRTVGFWIRRMAHETAVHRVDVMQAAGTAWGIDHEVAADGLDEAVQLWLGTQLGADVNGSGRVVRIGNRWSVRLLTGLVDYPLPSVAADAVVTGDPASLWAWAWGRTDSAHPVVITGSDGAAAEVRAALARAQQ